MDQVVRAVVVGHDVSLSELTDGHRLGHPRARTTRARLGVLRAARRRR
ncbi:hypothetical protein (plasmid) [Streptomyces leeuwenhoekii]|uniref:Uncharacterized protein n=1 Tax=Streptomyces leeuwenhoekii TaxID=1437453 RepID=A0A0F7VL92_STRLW|nr:hypothetical protein [Streptomyces leeuwenhoekii]